MTPDDAPFDPSSTQGRKRFLPSVSEVVRLVALRDPAADPAQVFKAARHVCSEELARVKQGQAAAPTEELAARAQTILAQGYPPPARSRAPVPAPEPPPPPPAFRSVAGSSDDPFSETTGALDLKWGREAKEPFEAGASPLPAEPPAPGAEPFELAAEPPPAVPFLLDDAAREAEHRGEALGRGDEPGAGMPGEETISRLEREASELPLSSVFPPASPSVQAPTEPLPPLRFGEEQAPAVAREPSGEEAAPPSRPEWDKPFLPERVPFQAQAAPARGFRPLLVLGSVLVLLVAAGAAWVFLGNGKLPGLPFLGGGAKPTTTPVPYLPASATTETATEPEQAPTPAIVVVPTELPVPTPVVADPTAVPVVVVPTRVPPTPVAAAVAETPRPVPVTTRAAEAESAPPSSPAPARPAGAGEGSLPRQSRPAPLVSPDWAGKAPAFVLHFASYRDRALAEKDAQRLARVHSRPAFALAVDLGAKGTYYRSVLGGFATGEEALAYRNELSAGGTPSVGFVYRVSD